MIKKYLTSLLAGLLMLAAAAKAQVAPTGTLTVYVSPTGLSTNPGTLSSPTTLAEAVTRMAAAANGVIWVRGGTYNLTTQITISRTNSGASDTARKRIQAYRNPLGVTEKPILDFSGQPYVPDGGSNPRGILLNGSFWYLRGLTVRNAADNGIFVGGNNNIVELCVLQANKDTGLQISRHSSSAPREEWPANNLILNCESFDNFDSPKGEDADGFAAKLTSGPGNIFKGCVAHNNIDDGWDLFAKVETGPIDPVTIIECIAYNNGVLTNGSSTGAGDRNGFKLGGDNIPGLHVVEKCIAFGNGKNGFTWNSNPAAIEVTNCTAWNNAKENFKFDQPSAAIFTNNVSFRFAGSNANDRYGSSSGAPTGPTNVFWFNTSYNSVDATLKATVADFISLTPPAVWTFNAQGPVLGDFAKLVAGSDLIDRGIPAGTDLGARESGGVSPGAVSIATQPAPQTVTVGSSATLTVIATGSAPISYQWYKDGTAIAGAVSNSLTFASAVLGDTANYTAVVTNSFGSMTSSIARLTVNSAPVAVAPSITAQPASQTVFVGASASFTVGASGTAPLSYQWKRDGTDIAGATSATYTLASAQLADAGAYSVTVSNSAGGAVSDNATLTVNVVSTPPSAPTALPATNVGSNGFTANWSTSAGATSYRLDVATDNAFANFVTGYQNLDVGSGLSANVTGLAPTTAYFSRIRAVNAAGASVSSNVITATTIAAAPPGNISIEASGTTTATVYSLTGSAYAQTFNTLPTSSFTWSNDTTLPGWFAINTAGTLDTSATVSDGSANLGDLKLSSVGAVANTDRALAYHTRVNTAPTYIGLRFRNNSGRTLDSFTLSYTPEQWKEGTNLRTVTLNVEYRVGSTLTELNATSGWTALPGLSATTLNGSAGATATLTASAIPVTVAPGETIWFRWITANSATTSTSSHDTLAIDNVNVGFTASAVAGQPVITAQPASQSVSPGANISFSVTATSASALSYQWKKNGSDIAGATSATFSIAGAQEGDAGNYSVVVTNASGSVTSNVATLAVIPVVIAPAITTEPQSQTVDAGATVAFTVSASGTAPFSYQWLRNGVSLAGATAQTLTLTNVTTGQAGSYTVTVTNSAGSDSSAAAVLTVNEVLSAPVITTQPVRQTVTLGSNATFSVVATGTAPLAYQWKWNGDVIPGATSATYTVVGVAADDVGNYSVTVSNSVGSVTSVSVALAIGTPTAFSKYNLYGFAAQGTPTTGGGVIPETDPAYRKVTTPLEFAAAIRAANKVAGSVKVIEIMNDLNLGWNEVGADVLTMDSTPFSQPVAPKLHPVLLASGVSTVQISPRNGAGLTIFSANGATIRHASWSIKNSTNIIIRNLKFDELWEWDEESKGDYDKNNWDFIVLGVGGGSVSRIWIDHCTFTKAYDGIIDTKGGTSNVTYSWNTYVGDDGATNPNSFVRKQVAALEANPGSYSMYNFLRTRGFSVEDIVQILQGPDKTTAIGELSLDPVNVNATVTFHHQLYLNTWDRLPRLAGGTAHNYNIYVDDAGVLAARRLRDARFAAMSPTDQATFTNNYNFKPPINGSISTEDGALLVEKSVYIDCLWPLRNNQTDPTNPIYTGKIMATDTIYLFHQTNGTTTYVRGNSTDAGNPLGPFQAPIKPFSWNTPDGTAPYTLPPEAYDDPADLATVIEAGAGSGVLTWSKENWLKTSY
jgi:pectate lyase